MTPRTDVREKLAKAVNLIVNTQNKEGGWRTNPKGGRRHLGHHRPDHGSPGRRNAGLFVPHDTIDRCTDYVKRSQNADGGFMYMLQGGGKAPSPARPPASSPSTAPALPGAEINKGLNYLGLSASPRRQPRESLFLWTLLRRTGDVARRRKSGPLVSGHSRRTDRPPMRRWVLARLRQRILHRHGLPRAASAQ